jgi:FMN phosphatase YigB (HAD superfamily)
MDKQKTPIVLDFDRVLFDTESYLVGLREAAGAFGVTKDHWADAGKKREGAFDLKVHADNLGKTAGADPAAILEAMLAETDDAIWYLFADSRPFLEEMREVSNLHLLTYGSDSFQTLKIEKTGLEPYFKSVTVTEEPKVDTPDLPVSSVDQAIFINDNIQEMLDMGGKYRWSHHLHVNRAGAPLPPNFPFRSFASLREATPFIRQLMDA